MATNNARVWDAYNQERPEEPNAVALPGLDAADIAWEMAEDIWSNIYAAEPVSQFKALVEMPDGRTWSVVLDVDWDPVFCAGETTEVKAP